MKIIMLIILISTSAYADFQGSQISKVWEVIENSPYDQLPQVKVNMKRLKKWGASKLKEASNRTIKNEEDLLPYFEKLVHPNGICLIGKWNITQDSEYSGYFKNKTTGLIISRASAALSETKSGKRRSFGMAGKIYPTDDFYHSENLKPANFFTIDDLAGTKIEKYSMTKLTNQPKLTFNFGMIWIIKMASFISSTFKKADSNPGLRQLWQISSLGEDNSSLINTPMWLRLSANKDSQFSDASDFRDEIKNNIESIGEMVFNIEVAGQMSKGKNQAQNFKKIGTVTYTKAVASKGCDHRLHFNHPKIRSDIK